MALAETQGPTAILALLDEVAAKLAEYHLLHAARGSMLEPLGLRTEASQAYLLAAQLARTEPEILLLPEQSRITEEGGSTVRQRAGPAQHASRPPALTPSHLGW